MGIVRLTPSAGWPADLDVAALVEQGHVPCPFRQFVLKLTARCDLACDYCYMFEMADQTWRGKPARMSPAIAERAAERIRDHALAHGLQRLQIALHGGEPLLVGPEGIDAVARILRSRLPAEIELDVRIQTNGLLLDHHMLETLCTHGIRVGVSLDGDRRANDRHRRKRNGQGSYAAVDAALGLIRRHHPELFSGLLCTIDLDNDPVTTYESLLYHRPPIVDLLLPLGHWDNPPPGLHPDEPDTPYADWLAKVFDRWYPVARRETSIRMFTEIIHLILGGNSQVESIGLSPSTVVVIDTDGAIEQVDTLRSAFHGAPDMELSILGNSLDDALLHPGTVARQLGVDGLCRTCHECPLHRICGGGYYPHRYRTGSGFLNPSVYCRDLQHLIRHVYTRVSTDLGAARSRAGTAAAAQVSQCSRSDSARRPSAAARTAGWFSP